MKEITTLGTKTVYSNRWMRVREDRILRQNGSEGIYGVVEKKDFAVIVPIDGRELFLVEQYRYPVEKRFWEFPQGSWEDSDLSPEALARAELQEETGLLAREIFSLGRLFVAYGYSNQGYEVFVATGLSAGSTDLDPEEAGLISRKFNADVVEKMILSGEIQDATTVAVFGLLKMKKILEEVPS